MTMENQPNSLPTNKAVVASVMTLAVFYLAGAYVVPPEILGAWTVLLEAAIGVIGGLLSAWPLRDRAGVPVQKPE